MITIKKAFPRRFQDGKLYNTIGINIKFIEQSQRDRVHQIAVCIVDKYDEIKDKKYLTIR